MVVHSLLENLIMAAGLQCYDATGKIVVDLTDRQLTFAGELTLSSVPGGTYHYEGTYAGISPLDTVGYTIDAQIGTSSDPLTRRKGLAVDVVAENTYRVIGINYISVLVPIKIRFFKFK